MKLVPSAAILLLAIPPAAAVAQPQQPLPPAPVAPTLDVQRALAALQMRFSNDGALWSAWEPYAAVRDGWDLSLGGDALFGLKTVRCEVRDAAINTSLIATDDISYTRSPVLDSILPAATLTLRYPEEPIRLAGDQHVFLTKAVLQKGSLVLTVPSGKEWSRSGRLEAGTSPKASTLYLPKPIEPGTWTLTLHNQLGASQPQTLTLTAPATLWFECVQIDTRNLLAKPIPTTNAVGVKLVP